MEILPLSMEVPVQWPTLLKQKWHTLNTACYGSACGWKIGGTWCQNYTMCQHCQADSWMGSIVIIEGCFFYCPLRINLWTQQTLRKTTTITLGCTFTVIVQVKGKVSGYTKWRGIDQTSLTSNTDISSKFFSKSNYWKKSVLGFNILKAVPFHSHYMC